MPDYIDEVFADGGLLAQTFSTYQPRPGQIALARAIDQSISTHQHLIGEAATGVGKSYAYLVPAIRFAKTYKRPVVVATANIALQEQIVKKDLPALQRVLASWASPGKEPFTFGLLKGKNNYVCSRRLAKTEPYSDSDRSQLLEIQSWHGKTEKGDSSELPFIPNPTLWSQCSGSQDDCDGETCAESMCFYKRMRRSLQGKDIIVCNYHILYSYFEIVTSVGKENVGFLDDPLLPPDYGLLVLDEAHEAAEIARDFAGFEISRLSFARLLKGLESEDPPSARDDDDDDDGGALPTPPEIANFLERGINRFFDALEQHFRSSDYRTRLKMVGAGGSTADLEQILVMSSRLWRRLARRAAEADDRDTRKRCSSLATQADNLRERVNRAMFLKDDPAFVYWLEEDESPRYGKRLKLCGKPVHVAAYLNRHLFPVPAKTDRVTMAGEPIIEPPVPTILTSATLSTGGTFHFIASEVGFANGLSLSIPSPFDFYRQVLFVVPTMNYLPNDASFALEVSQKLARIIELVGGRTLALFTSHKMLSEVHRTVGATFGASGLKGRYRLLKQGDMPRTRLVEEFRRDIDSCLFGTSSLWQGVDCPGETLTCVAIDRIPFPSPGDPVMDAITTANSDWFRAYSVPRAVVDIRQGTGRLVRSTTDYGILVVFDRRLMDKSYGMTFFKSLPTCQFTRDIELIPRFLDLHRKPQEAPA